MPDRSDAPKIVMTDIYREFGIGFQIDMEALAKRLTYTLAEVLPALVTEGVTDALVAMEAHAEDKVSDYYPDRLNDEELVWLSYKLPTVISLAILRYRLVRGLALRELSNKGLAFGSVESVAVNFMKPETPTQERKTPGSATFTPQEALPLPDAP